jgi:hypothetical protein
VKAAKGFSSEIVVVKGEREDAQEAVDALAHLGGGVG